MACEIAEVTSEIQTCGEARIYSALETPLDKLNPSRN